MKRPSEYVVLMRRNSLKDLGNSCYSPEMKNLYNKQLDLLLGKIGLID